MRQFITILAIACSLAANGQTGTPGKIDKAFNKGQQAVNKVQQLIAVFQPYLIKAQEIYGQGKALVKGVKNAAKGNTQNGDAYNTAPAADTSQANTAQANNTYPLQANNYPPQNNTYPPADVNTGGYPQPQAAAYPATPEYTLPVSNPSVINNDGSGNWGNQNNGLYGNCLDVLTGTVLGMGEAADNPAAVDLMFFAPADGQNTYYLMTPGFARNNNSTATYMTQHVSDQVQQWKDVTESEIALTKLTIGQFNQVQNNNQINSAVRNAQNYAGYYASVGQKMEGQVFAVKVQMENREVFALIAIDKQFGTSGSNGYLKIRIKAQGIDANNNGVPDANIYIR